AVLADGSIGDASGERPGGIHEFSASFSGTYFFEVSENLSGYFRADYLYESDTPVVRNIIGVNRSVNTVNAALGFDWENGLSVQIFARNLFNDQYFLTAFPTTIQAGTTSGYPNQPRTYGLSIGYNF
ncbi:MAG: TonB-dependent receptor, partial [Kordiimonadaceae bacterium]|nr:TonB-dependent receptor [Kordiimonadaceae bacterium]